jgi:uncharacterized protein (TIGR00730 family)
MKKSICVFCGSSPGKYPYYLDWAKKFGAKLVSAGFDLVYGGASIGLMGAVADGVLEAGGLVRGVLPHDLAGREIAHKNLTEMFFVDSMHERKQKMYDLSNAFVAIPGGIGTLDEFCEILTWAQLSYHKKPCYLLNEKGYFEDFYKQLLKMNEEGFLSLEHLQLVRKVQNTEEFIAKLGALY